MRDESNSLMMGRNDGKEGRMGVGRIWDEDIDSFEFKLGDLGMAKFMRNNEMTSTFAGTPLYMAPEIVNREKYNHKVDIWSMGALLFHLLTGHHPFYGKNLDELKQNLRAGCYKIPKDVVISIECLDFINSCLRFESCKRKDLDFLLSHPFLKSGPNDPVRESKLITKWTKDLNHKGGSTLNNRVSIELNTRNSFNFYEIYNTFLIKKIDQRLMRINQAHPIPPLTTEPTTPKSSQDRRREKRSPVFGQME